MNFGKKLSISVLITIIAFGVNQLFSMEEQKLGWQDLPDDAKMEILKNLNINELRQSISLSKDMKDIVLSELHRPEKPASFVWGFFKKVILSKTMSFSSENEMVIKADDAIIVTASDSNIVNVWDIKTGKLIKELEGHTSKVQVISISKDGKFIAIGFADCTIKLWDTKKFGLVQTLDPANVNVTAQRLQAIVSITISKDSKIIAASYLDSTIKIWEVQTGKCILIAQETQMPLCCTIDQKGTMIVSGGMDAKVIVRDLKVQDGVTDLYGHKDWVISIAISPNNRFVVTGSTDTNINIWDLKTNSYLKTLTGNTDNITCIDISDDSSLIVTGSWNGLIKVWDSSTGKCLKTFSNCDVNLGESSQAIEKKDNSYIRNIKIGHNNKYIIAISVDNILRIWNIENTNI